VCVCGRFNRRVLHFQPYSPSPQYIKQPGVAFCRVVLSAVAMKTTVFQKEIIKLLILKLKLCTSVLVARVSFVIAFITSSSSKIRNVISCIALPWAGHNEDENRKSRRLTWNIAMCHCWLRLPYKPLTMHNSVDLTAEHKNVNNATDNVFFIVTVLVIVTLLCSAMYI
jgi:hypothetical protein